MQVKTTVRQLTGAAVLTCGILVALPLAAQAGTPLGTGFTFQGQLKLSGSPLNDSVDMLFTVWDADSSGNVIGSTLGASNVAIVDGLFTVELDFGATVFDGDARWLEIDVRSPHDPTDTAPYTTLMPRQPLTATPYALQTRGLHVDANLNVGIGTRFPDVPMHVQGGSDTSAGSGGYVVLGALNGPNLSMDNNEVLARNDGNAAVLYLNQDASVSLCKNVGRVGIGTDFPDGRLSIENVGQVTGENLLSFSENEDAEFFFESDFLGTGSTGNALRLETNWSANAMTWRGDGNVGIGNHDPDVKLHVRGGSDLSLSDGGYIVLGNTAGQNLVLDTNEITTRNNGSGGDMFLNKDGGDVVLCEMAGRVGIGVNNPAISLHVGGGNDLSLSGGGYLLMGSAGGQNLVLDNNEIMSRDDGNTSDLFLNNEGGNVIVCGNAGGRVGIGNSSPSTELHVSGTVTADAFVGDGSALTNLPCCGAWALSGNDLYYADGHVGVGTDAPEAPLHVGGGNNLSLSGGGYIMAGDMGASNLVIDTNQIMARNNGSTANLLLNRDGGDVGISVGAPEAKLHIDGGTDTAESGGGFIVMGSTSGPNISIDTNEIMARNNGNAAQLFLNQDGGTICLNKNDGRTGIGTAFPEVKLHIRGGSDLSLGGGGYIVTGDTAGQNLVFDTNEIMARNNGNTDDLFLNLDGGDVVLCGNSGGQVGIGTTAPTEALHVVGNICATGTIGTCSDLRFKKRIDDVSHALSIVRQLRGVRFDWKRKDFADLGFSDRRQVGFIAQEVNRVLPEAVSTGSDGYHSVDYGRLTPVLVEAIKELDGVIESKDARIAVQEKQIAEFAERLERLERAIKE